MDSDVDHAACISVGDSNNSALIQMQAKPPEISSCRGCAQREKISK